MCGEHEDRAALGVCARCGTYLCAACGYSVGGQILCIRCHARIPASSMLTQLKIAAILYLVSAAFTLVGGTVVIAMAVYLAATDPTAGSGDPDAQEAGLLLFGVFGAVGALYLVSAIIQAVAGALMLKRRGRPFVIFAVAVTLLFGLLTGLPGLLALGLSVWVLIVILHRGVAAAFDRPRDATA